MLCAGDRTTQKTGSVAGGLPVMWQQTACPVSVSVLPLVDQFPWCMMAFTSPIEVDFCCYPGGCLAQEIRLSFWFNSLCGRMFETACDKELHCIDGWPGISLLPWKSRLHSDDKDMDLLPWATSSHRFWTRTQGRVMLFITPVYSQCCSFHAAFSSWWCDIN